MPKAKKIYNSRSLYAGDGRVSQRTKIEINEDTDVVPYVRLEEALYERKCCGRGILIEATCLCIRRLSNKSLVIDGGQ